MTTLYLIRGLPGSGKSTFAAKLLRCGLVSNVIEADNYFDRSDGYHFDASKLYLAHTYCQSLTKDYLRQESSIAVSNTSTTEKEVDTYRKIAYDYGAEFVSLIVETRHEGKNVHGVPDEKIQQMRQRFSIKL